jgi:hypothetical protein
MNIGEALLELKSMKSEMSRLVQERDNNFKFKIAGTGEGITAQAEVQSENFGNSTKEILKLAEKIRKLKIQVEITNHKSYVDTPEGKMTIAEAIHSIGDMRAELSTLEGLRENFKKDRYGYRDEDDKFSFQLSQKQLLFEIATLERKKIRLDQFLSKRNWDVALIE